MASEEEFVLALIKSVQKYPVLYEVDLVDYKNKNKKGEAFKQVQKELKEAGCSDFQAQCTYKKWISLKRKFRVEYFRLKTEEELTGNSQHSNFRFYNDLTFLIPYCEYYKSLKSATKRKSDDDDESDDDRFAPLQLDDNDASALLTLDHLFNAKRLKLNDKSTHIGPQVFFSQFQNQSPFTSLKKNSEKNTNVSEAETKFVTTENVLKNVVEVPKLIVDPKHMQAINTDSQNKKIVRAREGSENDILSKRYGTTIDPLSVLTQHEIVNFQQKCHSIPPQREGSKSPSSSSVNGTNETNPLEILSKESENALFGRLVANELDKLPENIHNVVRAQVLLLLANATSNTSNINITSSKLFPAFNL